MRLLQLQFGRVFDGDDAFLGRNERRERVQQRGFSGAGSARDDDVHLGLHGGFEQLHHARRHGQPVHQIRRHQLVGAETADRQHRPVHRERRNDGVDARAVAQARVHHGRGFVHAPADLRNDFVDDPQQVLAIAEIYGGQLQQALALDVNLPVGVDQNVGDGGILQQRLERAQAEHLVQHFIADLLFLERAEQRRLGIDERDERLADFAAHALVVDGGERLQVDLVHQLAVQGELQLLILRLERAFGLAAVFQQALLPADLGRRFWFQDSET